MIKKISNIKGLHPKVKATHGNKMKSEVELQELVKKFVMAAEAFTKPKK